jgi:flagellar basal body rod protein FlgC
MNSLSSISLSGLNAAQTRLQVAAHNIANLSTPDFRRQEVTQNALAGGGTRAVIGRADSTGSSLEADMVQQLLAKNSFLANLSVLKVSNETLGSLLDIFA